MNKKIFFSLILLIALSALSNEKHFIAQFLPENPVILEAGAHVGTDTVEMVNLWPKCTVYAFEPVPELFDK